MDEEKVAQLLEDVHDDMQEFKEYNNEHTLNLLLPFSGKKSIL